MEIETFIPEGGFCEPLLLTYEYFNSFFKLMPKEVPLDKAAVSIESIYQDMVDKKLDKIFDNLRNHVLIATGIFVENRLLRICIDEMLVYPFSQDCELEYKKLKEMEEFSNTRLPPGYRYAKNIYGKQICTSGQFTLEPIEETKPKKQKRQK